MTKKIHKKKFIKKYTKKNSQKKIHKKKLTKKFDKKN
jgi:hypothetical protein